MNPSTPDGIDRAIAKAKEAQKQWAKTTFKQRRMVLKTMLKYVEVRFEETAEAYLTALSMQLHP